MAINSQQLNIVVLVLAVIVVLFACISEGTYGWSLYEYSFNAAPSCDIDLTIGIGLYKSLSTTEYSSGCGLSDDTSTDNVNCDGLSDDQCTWLKNARAGSGIAVAFSVVMLILLIVNRVALSGNAGVSRIVSIIAVLSGLVTALSAWGAAGEWKMLHDDLFGDDDYGGIDVKLGYSWDIEITAGVLAIVATIIGAVAVFLPSGGDAATNKA